MEWTKEDTEHLRSFRNLLDSDDIKLKQEIKQHLLSNKYIVHVLNNQELEAEGAEPDEYFGVNIKPYYMVPEIQSVTSNFICYETSAEPRSRWDNATVTKYQQIIFYILCHSDTAIDKETAIARHDLLAALIMEEFNLKVFSCGRLYLTSNKPAVTDSKYLSRTLIFSCQTDANLVKTINGVTQIVNKRTIQ